MGIKLAHKESMIQKGIAMFKIFTETRSGTMACSEMLDGESALDLSDCIERKHEIRELTETEVQDSLFVSRTYRDCCDSARFCFDLEHDRPLIEARLDKDTSSRFFGLVDGGYVLDCMW